MTRKSYLSIADKPIADKLDAEWKILSKKLVKTMSRKVSITLDDEILEFIDGFASNRSSFINAILQKERQRIFLQELEAAYTEQSNDPEFSDEMKIWDVAVGDGLDA